MLRESHAVGPGSRAHLVLMAMFFGFLTGQLLTGKAEHNVARTEHGESPLTMVEYLDTGHPWEALFENWESEFLQMAIVVLLTTLARGVLAAAAITGIEARACVPRRNRSVNASEHTTEDRKTPEDTEHGRETANSQ